MAIFGFKSSKEVEEEKRKAAEAAERDALVKNQTNVSNLGKGSQVDFSIPFFDVFDPRLMDTGVPVSVHGSITYAIEDMDLFNSMNKTEAFSDETFKAKLLAAVTKYVKGVVSNVPCDAQIPLVQMNRRITQISDIVQNSVAPQVERNFAIKVRSLDVTEIIVNESSAGYYQLKSLTADFEQEKMRMQQQSQLSNMRLNDQMQKDQMMAQHQAQMSQFDLSNQLQKEQTLAQHNAQMKSFNLNNQIQSEQMLAQHQAQMSNFNFNNSLQQDQLRRTHEMNMNSQEQMAQMQLEGQRMQLDAQRIQLENQQETMRIQREEMQRASKLQTEQTFLGAHMANMQNTMMSNAMDYGYDPTKFGAPQQNTMQQQQPGFGQQNLFGQQQAFGAAPQMPTMKAAVPQVQYMVGVNGQQAGPFDWNQLQTLVQQGQLTVQSLVWTQGMSGWEMAGNVQELAPLFANTLPGMPTMM